MLTAVGRAHLASEEDAQVNFSYITIQSSLRYPDRIAIVDWETKRTLCYSELEHGISRVANHFAEKGYNKGDRVILFLPNSIDFVIGYFALLRIGATVITINPMLKGEELSYIVRDVKAAGLIFYEEYREEIKKALAGIPATVAEIAVSDEIGLLELSTGQPQYCELERVLNDDPVVIIYTSGTTGMPKGVMISSENLLYMNQACLDIYEYDEKDRVVGVLPFSHIFGQTALMTGVLSRAGSLLIQKRFYADTIMPMIDECKATVMTGVPTMYFHILNHPNREGYNLSSLRLCVAGGAAMPLDIYHRVKQEIKVEVMLQYGLTESGLALSHRIGEMAEKPDSVGIPVNSLEAKVVNDEGDQLQAGEIGELLLKGPNIIKEYYRKPEETSAVIRGGWLHTGDLAYRDDDGYIYIVDRKKEMILRGGFNIYPREIEEVLYTHPKIAEAAVIGVPDPAKGEEVKAFVAPKPFEQITTEELKEFCKSRIANYKCPSYFEILKELPKGSTGKILKKALKVDTQS